MTWQLASRLANKSYIPSLFAGLAGYFICQMCDFRAVSSDTLAIHNGTKHAYFIDLMPADIAESYRSFVALKTAGKKRPGDDLPNGAGVGRELITKNGDEKFACQICLAEFGKTRGFK